MRNLHEKEKGVHTISRLEETTEKRGDKGMRSAYKDILIIAGIAIAVFLGMRYILPVAVPFLFAWILVKLVLPGTQFLEKKLRIKKVYAGGFLLALLVTALGAAVYFLGNQLMLQIVRLAANFDIYMGKTEKFVDSCCHFVEKNTGIHAAAVQNFIYDNMNSLENRVREYTVPGVLKNSIACLMAVMKWLGVVLVVFVSFMLILKDYDEIKDFLNERGIYPRMKNIMDACQSLGGAWLKAQILIILIVTAVCTAGLWLLGYQYALLMGIVIGLLDALPFLGTGTILVPWGVFLLFTGDFWYGVCLIIIFLVANTLREFLEPKLIGDRIGVCPIVMVAAVYVGIYVYGIAGVILGPVSLILIIQIWHEIRG